MSVWEEHQIEIEVYGVNYLMEQILMAGELDRGPRAPVFMIV